MIYGDCVGPGGEKNKANLLVLLSAWCVLLGSPYGLRKRIWKNKANFKTGKMAL